MTRHFLSLTDAGRDGLLKILDEADKYRATRGTADAPKPLQGKSVALIFEKASTRTRVSLEVAVAELGGHPVVLTSLGSQISRGEPVSDTARVTSRMCQLITLRTFGHERLLDFVKYSNAPVLNALTDTGQLVLSYAEEIFSIGQDLMNSVKQRPTSRPLRLHLGVADALPKLVAYQIIEPIFHLQQPLPT